VGTRVQSNCAKTAEETEMPFEDRVAWAKELCRAYVDGGPDPQYEGKILRGEASVAID